MSVFTVPHRLHIGSFLRERRRQLPPQVERLGPHPRLESRVGRGVTQEEVAEVLGVTRVWYAMIEAGSAHISPRLLARIAETFEFSAEERLELLSLAFPGLTAA